MRISGTQRGMRKKQSQRHTCLARACSAYCTLRDRCQFFKLLPFPSHHHSFSRTMSAAAKVLSANPTELELQVAQAFVDLESSQADLKADLRPLQFKTIREIEVSGGKKAIAVFVPVPLLSAYHKVQIRLTRELEKKFPDRHVVFLAERRILPKPGRRSRQQQKRPRLRTLTAVHDKVLEDLVFPTEIVGKRVRYLVGGNKIQKVLLDSKDSNAVDYKLESFQQVYGKLTGKQVVFEIPGENVY